MKIYRLSPVAPLTSVALLARLYTTGGVVAVPGNFTTLTLDAWDKEDVKNAIVSASSLTPISSYIYGSLQSDRDWTVNYDSIGYNFAYIIPAAYLPAGGKVYQFIFTGDEGSGVKLKWAFDVPTLPLVGLLDASELSRILRVLDFQINGEMNVSRGRSRKQTTFDHGRRIRSAVIHVSISGGSEAHPRRWQWNGLPTEWCRCRVLRA
jgi:hypothetical protein